MFGRKAEMNDFELSVYIIISILIGFVIGRDYKDAISWLRENGIIKSKENDNKC